MKDKQVQQRQVIHVQLLKTDEHYYFGSIQAVYDVFTKDVVGVASQTLYNRGLDEPYKNDTVAIRKGILQQKRKTR